MIFDALWGLFSTDLAIDLGTAIPSSIKGKGIPFPEPVCGGHSRDSKGNKVSWP